ncbi:hypothetical protein ACFQ3J_07020 [Paenibacillus provencensis]|uniref:YesK-like protein n=1 Tax=Paenibacillus provencensis TaxID=441151 RepID=A0ABW3PSV1_9BACL|nr:hypothetical protein [Paenibacillus sp. MER 78]
MSYTRCDYLRWDSYIAFFVVITIVITILGFLLTKTKIKRAFWGIGQICISLILYFVLIGKGDIYAAGTLLISCFFGILGGLVILLSCFFIKRKVIK